LSDISDLEFPMPVRNDPTVRGRVAAPQTPASGPAAPTPEGAQSLETPLGPSSGPIAAPGLPAAGAAGKAWTVMGGAANAGASRSTFELLPGRYPDAVSLPDVLDQAATGPAGQKLIRGLVDHLKTSTGLNPPDALVNAVVAKPSRFAELLVATPAQMSAGVDALNVAYAAKKLPPLPPMPERLPNRFDVAKLGDFAVERPKGELKPLLPPTTDPATGAAIPGLFQGDVVNADLDDASAKQRMLVAEIFDRLANNADKTGSERFAVKYQGSSFTRLERFVDALRDNGHEVEVHFRHRVANFANLKTLGADGAVKDVPAALVVDTGVKDAKGRPAMLPAVHSEMVVELRSTEATKGPKLDATLKWYQGISGTGFFPEGLFTTPAWCGNRESASLSGDDAARAIHMAGLTSDVINASAAAQDLAVGGYGATGVCNDSVAVVQHVMTGQTSAYPLLMRDETLFKELKTRLDTGNHFDVGDYAAIRDAIDALPSDVKPNPSAKARARTGGLPWAPGAEPFQHVVDARAALE
jgi:hypothetical protein